MAVSGIVRMELSSWVEKCLLPDSYIGSLRARLLQAFSESIHTTVHRALITLSNVAFLFGFVLTGGGSFPDHPPVLERLQWENGRGLLPRTLLHRISKAGLARVRTRTVELAWLWVRKPTADRSEPVVCPALCLRLADPSCRCRGGGAQAPDSAVALRRTRYRAPRCKAQSPGHEGMNGSESR